MSETTNATAGHGNVRRRLLTTVSALALLTTICDVHEAEAADGDRPSLWIELGGQFDQFDAGQASWTPPFGANTSPPLATPPPTSVGATPHIGFDLDGRLSYQPDGSDWILSASVRYGRTSRGPKVTRDQSENYGKYGVPTTNAVVATRAEAIDRHEILDFSVGKDVGLGMDLARASISLGVRIAQFNSRLNAHMNSVHESTVPTPDGGNGDRGVVPTAAHYGDADIRRSFTGLGPSISWDASVPVLGSQDHGLSFDWNANGAILFGRQKTTASIGTKDIQHWFSYAAYKACGCGAAGYVQHKVKEQSNAVLIRDREVFVPNVGGLVGISYRLSHTKISFGYRADFFFGAIDGGVDSRKTYDRGFFGPFATISIGLGG